MSDEVDKQAHDFAIAVLNDYLSKHDLKTNIDEVIKLADKQSELFAIYYSAYWGFHYSWKQSPQEDLHTVVKSLFDKLRNR